MFEEFPFRRVLFDFAQITWTLRVRWSQSVKNDHKLNFMCADLFLFHFIWSIEKILNLKQSFIFIFFFFEFEISSGTQIQVQILNESILHQRLKFWCIGFYSSAWILLKCSLNIFNIMLMILLYIAYKLLELPMLLVLQHFAIAGCLSC